MRVVNVVHGESVTVQLTIEEFLLLKEAAGIRADQLAEDVDFLTSMYGPHNVFLKDDLDDARTLNRVSNEMDKAYNEW